jgi:hypothetical protein
VLRPGLRSFTLGILLLAAGPAWAHGPRVLVDRADAASAPVTATRPADAASPLLRSASILERCATVGAMPGSVELLATLIVVLGLAGLAPSWRRERRAALASATAGLLLGFVVEATPHLVHHSLDADRGTDCQVLQTAERHQAAVGALDTAPREGPAALDETPPLVAAPRLAAPPPSGRGPPA